MSEQKNEVKENPHPWRRFFAKELDLSISGIVIIFILYIVEIILGPTVPAWVISNLFFFIVFFIFHILLESLSLSRFSTTPGKWLFCIRVQTANGESVRFTQAIKRNFQCLCFGFALTIPPLVFFANLFSYFYLKKHGVTVWDKNAQTKVVHEEKIGWAKILTIILLNVALIAGSILAEELSKGS